MSSLLPRPTIADDTIHYSLHAALKTPKSDMAALATQILAYVDTLIPNHIWHRDSFELRVAPESERSQEWILEGTMRVGDSIDDEWLVVWLLWKISSQWDVVICVYDSDGEFLLIEAADALPSWVTPTNAENRVWIYRSHLHLVPLSYTSQFSGKPRRRRTRPEEDDEDMQDAEVEGYLSVQDGIRLVRDDTNNTAAPKEVEQLVLRRISGYPSSIRQHLHKTKAHLPRDIASALAVSPSLVQKAVEAFYTRDALQLKAAQKMARFPPSPSVLTTVRMTRTAYAQLMGQRFPPPRVFGRFEEQEGSKEWRWKDIGMKIACGFEMLYHETRSRSEALNSLASDQPRLDALRRDPEYVKYLDTLRNSGYFQGEIEGSEKWKARENTAAEAWVKMRQHDDATRPSFATQVNTALLSRVSPEELPNDEEDSDAWLTVDISDIDHTMAKYADRGHKTSDRMDVDDAQDNAINIDKSESAEDKLARQQAAKLATLAEKVGKFVEGQGELEGATFDDELLSDEEFSDEDGDSADEEEETKRLREEAMKNLVPPLDPSEYGKLPAKYAHANSQRTAPSTLESEMNTTADNPPASGQGSTEQAPLRKPVRRPIFERERYDGVDSDDESSEEEQGGMLPSELREGENEEEEEEEEEDRPQLVGDIELDMEEEGEEFLNFAREALGIDDATWEGLMNDRRSRGAFVPDSSGKRKGEDVAVPPSASKTARFFDEIPKPQARKTRTPAAGPRPNANPNLDSFEAVMKAMDEELAKSRAATQTKKSPPKPSTGKGKQKAEVVSDDDDEVEAAMDSELRWALKREKDAEEDSDAEPEEMDYNLIKNFLESFKSQQGLSGPVSGLAGRLQEGWMLPRDES